MAVSSAFVKVWIMPLAGGVPTWDSSTWYVENRLMAVRSQQTNGSMGEATFRLLRKSRRDDNTGAVVSTFVPVRGQYIAITSQACTLPGAAGTMWYGYIEDVVKSPLRNLADDIGTVSARQLGGVLDQVPLANPRIFDLTGATAAGIALLTIPTANAEGVAQGEVIGNAVDAPAGVQPGSGGATRRQWAGKAADCGTSTQYWSRWALLDHFVKWNYSALLPTVVLSAAANVQTLLDTAAKEVFKLQGLTLKGLVDLLAGTSRGLRWWVSISGNTWTINIVSAIDVAVGGIPAASLTSFTLTNDISVRLTQSGFDQYDAVEVNGNAIVFGGTISPIDSTMAAGWSASSATAYLAGASGAAGYGALTTDQQIARNRQVRKSGLLGDVFTRFLVAQDATYQFQCKNVAGVPVAGSVQFLCPLVTWIAGVAAIDDTTNMAPYPPEARLLRSLPWPEGMKGDGTDLRAAEAKARPKYLHPVVLSYQIPGALTWSDLCNPPFKYWHKPTIGVDARGPALRIEYEYPEMLAYASWGGAAISEYDPTLTTSYGASDYAKLVATVAMASDQRVKVASYKSGVTSTTYRNPLRVNRPDLHCWVVRKHTIVGLKTDGTPDEVATDTFVRNDFAVAQKLADELAAFAFRPRQGATITITAPHNPPAWASILTHIGTLTEPNGSVSYVLNTPVTSVEQVWDEKSPRLIITTGDVPMPDSTAVVGLVPSFGGAVSTALGMTLPAMAQRVDAELKEVQKAQERAPIITGRLPAASTTSAEYARVRWNFGTAQADLCEAQLVDSSGADLSPTALVWIDGYTSLRRVSPDLFGDVFYTAENTGTSVTRGGTTRPLYRVAQFAGLGAGTKYRIFQVEVTATASDVTAKVLDSAAAIATTTINGSALNNILLIAAPGDYTLAAVNRFDAQMPVRFHSVSNIPCLVPDILQTSRMRSGRRQNDGSTATITVSNLSIDPGEVFRVRVYAGDRASSGVTAEGSITILDEYARAVSGTNLYWYQASGAGGVEISGVSAGLGGGVQSTVASAATTTDAVYRYAGGATFTSVTLTITPTFNANGRIISIDVSGLTAGPTTAVVVEGGRPQFQTSGSL